MSFVDRRSGRAGAASLAIALLASACTPSPSPPATPTQSPAPSSTGVASPVAPSQGVRPGGTIHLLKELEAFTAIDPQRIYTAEDLAFFGATIYRSLLSYVSSSDSVTGTTLTPDLATDLGTATDGGRTWRFTLREGVTFQTGAPITCEDVKYGVSRSFANDLISGGPMYAFLYLDIPRNPITDPQDRRSTYLSAYYGPYDGTGQALFDKAVECSGDHRTITFHLNRPVGDFNYATTLGFSPVPASADTGETYGMPGSGGYPVSSGPYVIERYIVDEAGTMVLTRNPNWNPASDPIRRADPDRWEVHLGLDPEVIDQRLITAEGEDAFAVQVDSLQPSTAATIFDAGGAATGAYAGRAVSGFAQYARYAWINTVRIPNRKVRQAIMVALDRAAIRDIQGGALSVDFADGVLMPTIGQDYAPTGIWDSYFGRVVPTSGDPELAKELIRASGEPAPEITFSAFDNPRNAAIGEVVVASLARAGIRARYVPFCDGYGCGLVFDPRKGADMGMAGWGADWPNASTVIPALFTEGGGWDQSFVDDAAFAAAVDDALGTLDRADQASKWQELNRTVVENAWVVPMFFSRTQRLAGPRIAPVYVWGAYNSWPYRDLSVTP